MAKQTFTTGQVLTAAQMTDLQQTAMGGGSATAKTASYVLVAADAGTSVLMSSASATTITVNTALFSAGDTVYIQNIGAGISTITAGTATVTTSASLALAQWEGGTLYFTSTSAAVFLKGAGAAASSGITNGYDVVAATETTTSATFTNLTTAGPAVTLTTGTKALVIVSCYIKVSNQRYAYMGYEVSGATTIAATADTSYGCDSYTNTNGGVVGTIASRASIVTLTAGSNVFTAKYSVNTTAGATTGTYANRTITVINLG